MKTQNNENHVLTDFSVFKWMSFIPGETSIDDLSVMHFHGKIDTIIPEHFFSPTYILQIVTSGSVNASINNKEYEISPNSGYFIAPNFLIKRITQPLGYVDLYVISVSRKFVQEIMMNVKQSEIMHIYAHPVWTMSEKKTQRVIHYCELLREVIDDKNREAAKQLVHSLFIYLAGDYNGLPSTQIQTPLTREEEITGNFLALVDEHCEQQHSLDWYASKLCLSTRHVANTVKQTLDMTASSCIEHALIQRAKSLLFTSTMSIQEIADRLGFQNQSHFGTYFKRHEGISPAAFRKNN